VISNLPGTGPRDVFRRSQPTEQQVAAFWLRLVAFLIDLFIFLALVFFLSVGAGMAMLSFPRYEDEIAAALLILSPLLLFGGSALLESSRAQATPGKLIVGIAVTDLSYMRISFCRALVRALGKVITMPFLGFLLAGYSARRQTLYDQIASTLVVRRAKRAALSATPWNPPDLWDEKSFVDRCLTREYREGTETRTYKSDPRYARVLNTLNSRRFYEAVKFAEELVERVPDFDLAWDWLCLAYQESGRLDAACAAAGQGIERSVRKCALLNRLADLEWRRGNLGAAVYAIAQAIHTRTLDTPPVDVSSYVLLSYIAEGADLPDAAEFFQEVAGDLCEDGLELPEDEAERLVDLARRKGRNKAITSVLLALSEEYPEPAPPQAAPSRPVRFVRSSASLLWSGLAHYLALPGLVLGVSGCIVNFWEGKPVAPPGTPQQLFTLKETPGADNILDSGVIRWPEEPLKVRIQFSQPPLESVDRYWYGKDAYLQVGDKRLLGTPRYDSRRWASDMAARQSEMRKIVPYFDVPLSLPGSSVSRTLEIEAVMTVVFPEAEKGKPQAATRSVAMKRSISLFVVTKQEMSLKRAVGFWEDRWTLRIIFGSMGGVSAIFLWNEWGRLRREAAASRRIRRKPSFFSRMLNLVRRR
jgi:uncharacterized RDD family membrane protein YckC